MIFLSSLSSISPLLLSSPSDLFSPSFSHDHHVLAAQPPATASYKSSKPTLIPWELQKIHPTYVPSRIPTYTFEFIDGGLAYGAAQEDGYHPESMPGYHEFRRTTRRRTSQQQPQQQQPQQQTEGREEEKIESKGEEKSAAEVPVEESQEKT